MTHKEKLLRYFKEEKNTITTMEGFTQLHILHIPSVIRDLKEDGYTIKSSYIKYKDRWGKSRPFIFIKKNCYGKFKYKRFSRRISFRRS